MKSKSEFDLVGPRSVGAKMVNCLADDLRNPITSIQACVAMLDMAPGSILTERDCSTLQIIGSESARLSSLIDQLLFCSSTCGVPPQEFELVGLIKSVLHRLANEHPLRLKAQFCATGSYCTRAHSLQISRALENVLVNAAEATQDSGDVTVQLGSSSRKGFHQIRIKDTGVGVPDYLKDRLFNSFASAKLNHLGVGLTIAHQIITGNGGTLELNSRIRKGAEFIIELPAI